MLNTSSKEANELKANAAHNKMTQTTHFLYYARYPKLCKLLQKAIEWHLYVLINVWYKDKN